MVTTWSLHKQIHVKLIQRLCIYSFCVTLKIYELLLVVLVALGYGKFVPQQVVKIFDGWYIKHKHKKNDYVELLKK